MAYTHIRSAAALTADIADFHLKVLASAQQERFKLLRENHWKPFPINGTAAWGTSTTHLHDLGIATEDMKELYSEAEALWLECKAIVFSHVWRELKYNA